MTSTSQSYLLALIVSIAAHYPCATGINLPFQNFMNGSAFDLQGLAVTFVPDLSFASYTYCAKPQDSAFVSTFDAIKLSLDEDDALDIDFSESFPEGFRFPFFGEIAENAFESPSYYDKIYVSNKGYITFGKREGDVIKSIDAFFDTVRIAPLASDLEASGGDISYKILTEHVVSINFNNLRSRAGEGESTVQMLLHCDGRIEVYYEKVNVGEQAIMVGISDGRIPSVISQYDLSGCGEIPEPGPTPVATSSETPAPSLATPSPEQTKSPICSPSEPASTQECSKASDEDMCKKLCGCIWDEDQAFSSETECVPFSTTPSPPPEPTVISTPTPVPSDAYCGWNECKERYEGHWCNSNKDHCEGPCQGQWCDTGIEPAEFFCGAWDCQRQMGPWCTKSQENCEGFCDGRWCNANPKPQENFCGSWDCKKRMGSWCTTSQDRCEGPCTGRWCNSDIVEPEPDEGFYCGLQNCQKKLGQWCTASKDQCEGPFCNGQWCDAGNIEQPEEFFCGSRTCENKMGPWCTSSQDRCERQCAGRWCSQKAIPMDLPTPSPTSEPSMAPTQEPSLATPPPTGEPVGFCGFRQCTKLAGPWCNRNKENCLDRCKGTWCFV